MVQSVGRRRADVVDGAMSITLIGEPDVSGLQAIGKRRPDVVGGAMKTFLVGDGNGGASALADRIDIARKLGIWTRLGSSAVAVSLTGTTAETVLATIPIPAGAMGANGLLKISFNATSSGGAGNKVINYRLGGLLGTSFVGIAVNSSGSARYLAWIQNRNSESSQVGGNRSGNPINNSSAGFQLSAIDTSVDTTLVITGDLADGADTVTLEQYLVEIMPIP